MRLFVVMLRNVFWMLFAVVAQSSWALDFENCSSVQVRDVTRNFRTVQKTMVDLSGADGLATYDLGYVNETYQKNLTHMKINPAIRDADYLYQFLLTRLEERLREFKHEIFHSEIIFQCNDPGPDCGKGTAGYVDFDPKLDVPLDRKVHLCPSHFTDRRQDRVGTLAHELSHLLLMTSMKHPSVDVHKPSTFLNLTNDAYFYGALVSEGPLPTLQREVWRKIWFNQISE